MNLLSLHAGAETKRLLESLAPDVDREHLEGAFLRRERQYHETRNRAAALTDRLAAIAESLPDASARQVKDLDGERRELLIERLAMPADLTVAAKNYAQALSDWTAATLAAIDQERHAAQTALASTETAFREASWTLDQFAPGTVSPAYDQAHATWRELAGQRQPFNDRIDDLTRLEGLVREFAIKAIPGKIVNGNPSDGSLRRFVDSAQEAAR